MLRGSACAMSRASRGSTSSRGWESRGEPMAEQRYILHQGINGSTIQLDTQTGNTWVLTRSRRVVDGKEVELAWWCPIPASVQEAITISKEQFAEPGAATE
jgi:hypothetical protein